MNLVIALLSARRFVPKEQLRTLVAGYHGLSDEAYERQFERDKNDLRAMGVPVEMGSNSALFDDEMGYRIQRAAFQLPKIEFTPEEVAALAAASQVWQQATVAESTARALAKLGSDAADSSLKAFAPSVNAKDAAFLPLWRALTTRRAVAFGYRDGPERTVEPWRLVSRRGTWYLLGYDRGKGEPRTFRLSRISGAVRSLGKPEAFTVPTGLDITAYLKELDASPADAVALVAIRDGRAADLTARGEPVEWPTALPPGFSAWRLSYHTRTGLVADVATAGCDALPLDPPELVMGVRAHLSGLIANLEGAR
jgi:proteasome accessory factor B